jgi:hypothetical protein
MNLPDLITAATSPTPATVYLGSPDIIKLASGDLLLSYDEFGPGAHTDGVDLDRSHIRKSTDGGATWADVVTTDGMFFPSFLRGVDGLYRIGVSRRRGAAVISQSVDNGATWGTPVVIDNTYNYSQAPQPSIVRDGILYFSYVTDSNGSFPWDGIVIMSCPVDELMTSASWTVGAIYAKPASVYGVNEPCLFLDESGDLKVWVRVDSTNQKCEILDLDVGVDLTLTLSQRRSFDGGNVKFQVIKDDVSGDYFCARNSLPISDGIDRRTLLALDRSSNLGYWRRVAILAKDAEADYADAGHQYPTILIDGDDILCLIRTGVKGIADDYHNSDRIEFCRIQDFRQL